MGKRASELWWWAWFRSAVHLEPRLRGLASYLDRLKTKNVKTQLLELEIGDCQLLEQESFNKLSAFQCASVHIMNCLVAIARYGMGPSFMSVLRNSQGCP